MVRCTLCRDPIAADDADDAVLGAVLRRDGSGRENPERSRLLGAFHGRCWKEYRADFEDGIQVEACPKCKGMGMLTDETLDQTPEHSTPWLLDCEHCKGRGWIEDAA
jgi:hypothetical protein